MSSFALRVVGLAFVAGAAAGAVARLEPHGNGWLVVLLAFSAGLVALAQQTLP